VIALEYKASSDYCSGTINESTAFDRATGKGAGVWSEDSVSAPFGVRIFCRLIIESC